MANELYSKGVGSVAKGEIIFNSHTMKAVLIDTTLYTYNRTSHQYLSSIPSGAQVAITTLTGCTVGDDGLLDCDPAVFTTVSGAVCAAIAIYRFVTNDADSRLLAYGTVGTGVPITPDGSNITVDFPTGVALLYQP